MSKSIKIPEITQDDRIGSVFNHLFGIIADTEHNDGCVEWDFNDTSFLHPFFIGPLAFYKDKCGYQINCNFPNNTFIERYLNLLNFSKPFIIDGSDQGNLEFEFSEKTYTPIVKFSNQINSEKAQLIIENILKKKIDSKLYTPISYFLSELICNINEHSNCMYGYLFAQILKRDNTLNICIADDGISIYGSYIASGKYYDKISSEASALKIATQGYSTKNLPFTENRGYGLSTTTKMLIDGLGGSLFILSGHAFHRHDNSASQFVNLPDEINWDGTVILLRIPLTVPHNFNYIEFIS